MKELFVPILKYLENSNTALAKNRYLTLFRLFTNYYGSFIPELTHNALNLIL